ncbi:MAG: hypothetical protein KA270_02905 [Saprospiraceae bacterium]|nr:hypothetical protein [Saprospiraceae bacterium]
MKYNNNLFEKQETGLSFVADEIEEYDIILLSKNRFFYVFDLDKEFINDEISELYEGNDNDILPEHTKIILFDESDKTITDIPGDAPVIIYRRINKEA